MAGKMTSSARHSNDSSSSSNSTTAAADAADTSAPTTQPSMMQDIKRKREKLQLFQSESHKLKTLMTTGASVKSGLSSKAAEEPTLLVNPLLMQFPTRCIGTIRTAHDMRRKLEYFAHSDDVMVVLYTQDGCTACNALDKVTEMLCHEAATRLPNLRFFAVNRNASAELTRGLVRYPQLKAYSGGQWADLDFKPPSEYRDKLYGEVQDEVQRRAAAGAPVTALQAEEMYFAAAAPAMTEIARESVDGFYCRAQVRLHNYWRQISVRRTWFFRRFVRPHVPDDALDASTTMSVFGEKIVYGPRPMPDNFTE